MVNAATNSSPVILLCLLCAAPAAAEAGHGRARATAVRTGAEALVGAPAEAAPLDRVGESPRRLSGYVMDDSTIRTAVAAWLSDSAAAELTYGHISTWETGGVTGMEYLFCAQSSTNWWLNQGCNAAAASFNDDISAWDTSGVTSLFRMFHTNPAFNQDLSGWSLDSVLYMEGVFIGASSFNQPIGGWQVQNVKKMDLMFYKASSFNQDLSGWCMDDSVNQMGEHGMSDATAWGSMACFTGITCGIRLVEGACAPTPRPRRRSRSCDGTRGWTPRSWYVSRVVLQSVVGLFRGHRTQCVSHVNGFPSFWRLPRLFRPTDADVTSPSTSCVFFPSPPKRAARREQTATGGFARGGAARGEGRRSVESRAGRADLGDHLGVVQGSAFIVSMSV